jgi:hypothetical protein
MRPRLSLAMPNFSAKNRCGVKLVSVMVKIPLKVQTANHPV